MKELSIEQKAKAYDEALKQIKECTPDENGFITIYPQEIFSELQGEDERIRKVLISQYQGDGCICNNEYRIDYKDIRAWLEKQAKKIDAIEDFDTEFEKQVSYLIASAINKEHEYNQGYVKWTANALLNYAKHELEKQSAPTEGELEALRIAAYEPTKNWSEKLQSLYEKLIHYEQGEQKPSNKVEPKFHEGDWCIDNGDGTIFQIVKVLDNTYTYKTNVGKEYSCTHYSLENDAKLWTIQDTKDGDVLSYRDGQWIFIYKKLVDGDTFCYHALYSTIHQDLTIDDAAFTLLGSAIIPATKEQRDTLFTKMKEAGYEFDFENKELKKIEQKFNIGDEEKKK